MNIGTYLQKTDLEVFENLSFKPSRLVKTAGYKDDCFFQCELNRVVKKMEKTKQISCVNVGVYLPKKDKVSKGKDFFTDAVFTLKGRVFTNETQRNKIGVKEEKFNELSRFVYDGDYMYLKNKQMIEGEKNYVQRQIYNNKEQVSFFYGFYDGWDESKCGVLKKTLENLEKDGCSVLFKKRRFNVISNKIKKKTHEIYKKLINEFHKSQKYRIVNLTNEEEAAKKIQEKLKSFGEGCASAIVSDEVKYEQDTACLVIVKSKSVYDGLEDAYDENTCCRDGIIQHIVDETITKTIKTKKGEEKVIDITDSVVRAVIKEVKIKTDVFQKEKITFFDWQCLNLEDAVIFGKSEDVYGGVHAAGTRHCYFMKIEIDGEISFFDGYSDGNEKAIPSDIPPKVRIYVMDKTYEYVMQYKNSINTITKTNTFFLPDFDAFQKSKEENHAQEKEQQKKTISRSRQSSAYNTIEGGKCTKKMDVCFIR